MTPTGSQEALDLVLEHGLGAQHLWNSDHSKSALAPLGA